MDEREELPDGAPVASREVPSQILPRAPFFHGPLMAALIEHGCTHLALEMHPDEPQADEQGVMQAEPPACGWRLEGGEGDADGPLSLMSFMALWNENQREVDGIPVKLVLHAPRWAAATPFVVMHPSGFAQAVSYDLASGSFVRQILYPAWVWPAEP